MMSTRPLIAALTSPLASPADVLELWACDSVNMSLPEQAGHIVRWLDRLLVGQTTGFWGDDWLAEARQMHRLMAALSDNAVSLGIAGTLMLPAPDVDAVGFCEASRAYFHDIAYPHGVEPMPLESGIAWFARFTGPVALHARIPMLMEWLVAASYGRTRGPWTDLWQEVLQIEAVFYDLMLLTQEQGFFVPEHSSAAADPHGFTHEAWRHLQKIAAHVGTGHAVIELQNAMRSGRH